MMKRRRGGRAERGRRYRVVIDGCATIYSTVLEAFPLVAVSPKLALLFL